MVDKSNPPKFEPSPSEEQTDTIVATGKPFRFGISNFRSEITKNGILQNNKFVCLFAIPKGLQEKYKIASLNSDSYRDNLDDITLRCETVTVPGQNFFTQDVKRYGYGQIEKKPYLPTFNPMRMVFLVDRQASIIKFFNDWVNLIIPHNVETPTKFTDLSDDVDQRRALQDKLYLVGYKDEYICPVLRINVYNEYNQKAMECKVFDCFPLTVSDFDTSWSSQNDPIRLTVTMQFVHSSKEFYDSEENLIKD
jgi:hypothetical protein